MKNKNLIITVVIVIIVGAAAFFGGMKYQEAKARAGFAALGNGQNRQFFAGQAGQGGPSGQRRGGGFGGGVIGEILSIDTDSITVKLPDGSSKIVLVSGSTAINKQASGSKIDLQKGVKVAVFGTTNSDGSVTAQNIQLNPVMRRISITPPVSK